MGVDKWSLPLIKQCLKVHIIYKSFSYLSQQTLYPLRHFHGLLGWVVTCSSKHPNRTTDNDNEGSMTYTHGHPYNSPGLRQVLFFYTSSEKTEALKREKGLIKSYIAGKLRSQRL